MEQRKIIWNKQSAISKWIRVQDIKRECLIFVKNAVEGPASDKLAFFSFLILYQLGSVNLIKTSNFPGAKRKLKKLIPIVNEYCFDDISKAIFCICVCVNNRSVRESTLALNWALAQHNHKGDRRIESYDDFIKFFYSIEKTIIASAYDDAVVEEDIAQLTNKMLTSVALSLSKLEMDETINYLCPVAFSDDKDKPNPKYRFPFALVSSKGIILPINSSEYSDVKLQKVIERLIQARDNNSLYLVELMSRNNDGKCRGITVLKESNIKFMIYDAWSNPSEMHIIRRTGIEELHYCTSLDIVYYLLFMKDADELHDYLDFLKEENDFYEYVQKGKAGFD